MTNKEVINVLNTIYENPTASEQIKEACIVAMEAVDIKNSVERIATGLEISSEETCENLSRGMEMIFECSVCGASTIDRMNWENGDFNFCPNCGRRVEK